MYIDMFYKFLKVYYFGNYNINIVIVSIYVINIELELIYKEI